MTRKKFSEIIKCFHPMTDTILQQMENKVDQYPYCQTLWMLLAAGWALHEPLKFQQNLPKIATIVPNRSQLKEVVSRAINKSPLIISLFSIIEKTTVAPSQETAPPFFIEEEATSTPSITENDLQMLMNQLEEIENDISNFMDEIQSHPQQKPLDTIPASVYDISKIHEVFPEKNAQLDAKKNETLLLIDRFLEKQPTISRTTGEFFNPENVIEQSIDNSQHPVSETLAIILEHQGQPQKAIEIYQKLILENPEKSTYFAARIENLSNI